MTTTNGRQPSSAHTGRPGWPEVFERLPAEWLPALLPIGRDKRPRAPSSGQLITGWASDPPGTYGAAILGHAPAVGLRLGPISGGTLALDFDGPDSEPLFEATYGRPSSELPPTVAWTSGKDGRRQEAFRVPPERWDALRDRVTVLKAPAPSSDKLEHRWIGQQSVIMGAHPETGAYQWVDGCAPWEVEVAEVPDWLLDLMPSKRPAPPQASLPLEPQAIGPAAAGGSVPLRDFISRDSAALIEAGSLSGNCNEDGLRLSLELVAVEAWLRTQGAAPDETARDAYASYLSHCPEWLDRGPTARAEAFDYGKAMKRFDGAAALDPKPSTPEDKLIKRLGYHRWLNEQNGKEQGEPQYNFPDQEQQPPPPKPPADRFTPRPDTKVRWGAVKLSLNKRLDCFDRCLQALTTPPGPGLPGERNTIRRWAKVRHVLEKLDLKNTIRLQDIGQAILEKLDERSGNTFQPLTAADREAMPMPTVEWEIPNCIPRGDLTILGGRAKVGKTRLANALVRSLLLGEDFLDFGPPTEQRKIILITDDQGDGDTAQMLSELKVWSHPELIWSRRFRVTEKNIDRLLQTINENPGAVVVLDSLRSITRSASFGENDPEMGSLIYDLKQAVIDAGGSLLLIHHANKANDTTGTEALSGHNAIAGAANTILTMHYLAKGNKLVKDSPQRRLVREARSGPPADLVISMLADGGSFYRVGDYEAFQEEQEGEDASAKAAKHARKANPKQQEALRYLQAIAGSEKKAPGLLDLCQAIDLVPFGARMKKDLEGDDLKAYKAMGRFLGELDGLVLATRVASSGQGYYLTYSLSEEGLEWVCREFELRA